MYWKGGAIKWWALKVLTCCMGSSTHNKTSQVYEKTGFYPFNGVTMWNRKISIYKSFHKKYFFSFLCKNKIGKKVIGVARWKVKIYSKNSSNKEKTKKEENKSRTPGIKRFIPDNDAIKCCRLSHTWGRSMRIFIIHNDLSIGYINHVFCTEPKLSNNEYLKFYYVAWAHLHTTSLNKMMRK